ncbi:hypothetical protein BDV95DRAFT_302288 [Massariosphaeria phaeospora]|uniref:Uncharacterized protein n=1 Tax=Massariosphaeria phaeospora TaxID=100035 RepID=A0A7C8ICX6_9PLEO|nr:hypothetical protein BDV95DRAFT_302288 [Massariosphaeria phaeospora]
MVERGRPNNLSQPRQEYPPPRRSLHLFLARLQNTRTSRTPLMITIRVRALGVIIQPAPTHRAFRIFRVSLASTVSGGSVFVYLGIFNVGKVFGARKAFGAVVVCGVCRFVRVYRVVVLVAVAAAP